MAAAILVQMRQNMWRTTTTYRVTLNALFNELKPQAFDGSGKDAIRDYRKAPERLSEIKRFIFFGFQKGCYWQAKFDSNHFSDHFFRAVQRSKCSVVDEARAQSI